MAYWFEDPGIKMLVELMLGEFYTYQGLDPATGQPVKEKLVELVLENSAADMYP